MVLLENIHTLDVEDVAKTHSMYVIILVLVVDSLMLNEENTLGSNGTRKCKKLNMVLKMRLVR